LDNGLQAKQVVVYDVPQEYMKLRSKIVGILQDYGLTRLQYSVFIGNLTMETLENLILRLKKIKPKNKADIRIFLIRSMTANTPSIITISEAEAPHPSTNKKVTNQGREVLVF
jgi:CRISPR-associated endonuclease Cas2